MCWKEWYTFHWESYAGQTQLLKAAPPKSASQSWEGRPPTRGHLVAIFLFWEVLSEDQDAYGIEVVDMK